VPPHPAQRMSRLNIVAAPGHTTFLRESDETATVLATTPNRLAGLLTALIAGRLSPRAPQGCG
jgi:hypothetical protein